MIRWRGAEEVDWSNGGRSKVMQVNKVKCQLAPLVDR